MSMVLPGVVGFKLNGKLRTGVTATDLVLTVTQVLRKMGVVGKFVEFYGKQSSCLSLSSLGNCSGVLVLEYGQGCLSIQLNRSSFCACSGKGLSELSLADRATIANMSPEYGATMGFFPVDRVTLGYLRMTGRDEKKVMVIPFLIGIKRC